MGYFGSASGKFTDPVGIVVDEQGVVSVLDDARNVIESYDADGSVLGSIEAFPNGMQNNGANRLALGPNGHFYVSMAGPVQVIELDRDGSLGTDLRRTRHARRVHRAAERHGVRWDRAGVCEPGPNGGRAS